MLKLTEEVREFAKRPFGKLYEGEGIEIVRRALESVEFFACVGDIVSFYTLKAGFKPNIIVYDGKSIRKQLNSSVMDEINYFTNDYSELIAENPAGCITEDLVEKIRKAVDMALAGGRVRLFVKGEEDLSVMPLVALMPEGAVIVYGQPSKGVVRVDVNEEKKVIIFEWLEKMQSFGDTLKKLRRWANGDSR